jgi:hypothetical protein
MTTTINHHPGVDGYKVRADSYDTFAALIVGNAGAEVTLFFGDEEELRSFASLVQTLPVRVV